MECAANSRVLPAECGSGSLILLQALTKRESGSVTSGRLQRSLNAVLKEQALDDEGLSTLMCEVEVIVYSRPITKSFDDPSDCEALTPNHLLLLRSGPCLPPGSFSEGRRTLPEEMATGSVSR